jgi:hypothetical protein
MQVLLQLNNNIGADLGPFQLAANVGSITPTTATRTQMLEGIITTVSDNATSITVTSTGNCTNSITLPIQNLPPGPDPEEPNIYISSGYFNCETLCTTNVQINIPSVSTDNYPNIGVGSYIYNTPQPSGYYAISEIPTDTQTGPFKIAQTDEDGMVIGLAICSGGQCTPL